MVRRCGSASADHGDGEKKMDGVTNRYPIGYERNTKAIGDHVDDEDKGVTKCDTLGGVKNVINTVAIRDCIQGNEYKLMHQLRLWRLNSG